MTEMQRWEYGEVTFLDHIARDRDAVVTSGTITTASRVEQIPEGSRLNAMNELGEDGWLLREVQHVVAPGENAFQEELIRTQTEIRRMEGEAKPDVISYSRFEMRRPAQKAPSLRVRWDGEKLVMPE